MTAKFTCIYSSLKLGRHCNECAFMGAKSG